jgi:uncharacterized membrane protein
MSLIGHFHPLLVHFPIALVLAAAATELVAISRPDPTWHAVAVANGNFAPAMTAVPVGTTVNVDQPRRRAAQHRQHGQKVRVARARH